MGGRNREAAGREGGSPSTDGGRKRRKQRPRSLTHRNREQDSFTKPEGPVETKFPDNVSGITDYVIQRRY